MRQARQRFVPHCEQLENRVCPVAYLVTVAAYCMRPYRETKGSRDHARTCRKFVENWRS